MISGIYAITDPQLLPGDRLFDGVQAALQGGIRWFQYRDKLSTAEERAVNAARLVSLCRDFDAHVIINDSVELARHSGAAGVHLGTEDGPVSLARTRLGPAAVIGATCHDDLPRALQARSDGADYVAFGRFFPSATKPLAPPATVELLRAARQQLGCPIVAIGGITQDNMADLIAGGANAIALCHELFTAPDIEHKARSLTVAFKQAETAQSL